MESNNPACREYVLERSEMVDMQIRGRGISTPSVLDAMKRVPRHLFVPAELVASAYADCALPIDFGQTISQPYIVGLMTDLLRLRGDETILEVGTGSGYQAAILAEIAARVISLEIEARLVRPAVERLQSLGINNAEIHLADGSCGYPESAPYDGILVTAAAPETPAALLDQLNPGGRLVIPVGSRWSQVLQVWKKDAGGHPLCDENIGVRFVPLRGRHGWA